MLAKLFRALRPHDDTHVQAAFAEMSRSARDKQVRARALRMDVSCGNPVGAVKRMLTHVDTNIPPDWRKLLDRI